MTISVGSSPVVSQVDTQSSVSVYPGGRWVLAFSISILFADSLNAGSREGDRWPAGTTN
jgi:hypothetical protein